MRYPLGALFLASCTMLAPLPAEQQMIEEARHRHSSRAGKLDGDAQAETQDIVFTLTSHPHPKSRPAPPWMRAT